MAVNIHATCVSLHKKGILFIGPSGAGKSDLSLRLILSHNAKLVADDRVDISLKNNMLTASAPKNLQGLLEVRGVGIIKKPFLKKTKISAVIELISTKPERMPETDFYKLCEKEIPLFKINPFEASASEKVLAILSLL